MVGEPQGKSPSGTVSVSVSPNRCSGFKEETICITYNIPSGTQLSYHENPGKSYNGKTDTAYLPFNKEGKNLLKRLKYSFLHGITFTVGTSMTSGKRNMCTWASVHHKTSRSGGAHGFPDSNYFSNCNGELDFLGVPSAPDLDDDGKVKVKKLE